MIGVGRILVEEREARGLSLDEAANATRIGRRFLLALETEDFSQFPAPAQARGFLRVYSRYLGLDPEELLVLLPSGTGSDSTSPESQRVLGESPRTTLPRIHISLPVVIVAAAAVVVVIVCGAVATLVSRQNEAVATGRALLSEGRGPGIRVPDVRDDDIDTARRKMNDAGIVPLIIEVPSDRVREGLVIRQEPEPGTVILRGSDVTIIASRGVR